MNNYEYCARFAVDRAGGREFSVLDYGCGAGRIVALMRERGLDAFGCDVFYGGGGGLRNVPPELMGTAIRRIEDGRIPFPDGRFDLVISNQVMEHVEDLNLVLQEIHRVLKPGGEALSIFPDRDTWREGHCGVPFLHRFPKGSTARVYYALAWRTAGFGSHKQGKGRLEWSRHKCRWLDDWTHYRTYDEIRRIFARYFTGLQHLEHDRIDKRLGPSHPFTRSAPRWLKRFVTNKLGGLVVVCTREDALPSAADGQAPGATVRNPPPA